MSSLPSRGRCVFCDRPIPASDPPEHVIPTWMKRFRPKDTAFTSRLGIVTKGELRGTFTQPSPLSMRPDITTDAVCRQCNGGWMSDLETRASQLLPSMIDGEKRQLTAHDHAFLAVWATKTVMTWQTTKQLAQPIPLADYRWLRAHLTRHLLPSFNSASSSAQRSLTTGTAKRTYGAADQPTPQKPPLAICLPMRTVRS